MTRDPIRHALALCRLITDRPQTRAELAYDLSIHERTVRRLIDALRDSGADITQARRSENGPMEYRLWSYWK